jgi:hypothetical protein
VPRLRRAEKDFDPTASSAAAVAAASASAWLSSRCRCRCAAAEAESPPRPGGEGDRGDDDDDPARRRRDDDAENAPRKDLISEPSADPLPFLCPDQSAPLQQTMHLLDGPSNKSGGHFFRRAALYSLLKELSPVSTFCTIYIIPDVVENTYS